MISTEFVVACDHPSCVVAMRSASSHGADARRQARRLGWGARLTRHSAGAGFSRLVDYCPAHVNDHLTDSVDAGPL